MRSGAWLRSASACCALLAVACAARPTVESPAAHDALQQERRACLEAMAARDVARTVACFADDAVIHPAGMPAVRGRDAIRHFYSNVFAFIAESRMVSESLRVAAAGDLAWEVGSTTNVFRGAEGAVEYEGKYLLVWERQSGGWRIAAYTLSSDRDRP